jgi:bifunctional non-homologous end joining protein LigD
MPSAAVLAEIPRDVRLQIVSSCAEPPAGDGWLHELKHDGHRLLAIIAGNEPRLISRNGHDRTKLFHAPFHPLAAAELPAMVLDGEIAVPDERGVTHIDGLTATIRERRPEQFAYFAFDILHHDGHDLRRCPIEDRKALLRDLIGAAGCPRLVYVDHVVSSGAELLEAVRQVGAEGIVSKRRCSLYRGGPGRDWLKAKVSETGVFVIIGFAEVGEGRLDVVYVAEVRDGRLVAAGSIKFGIRRGLWHRLDRLRAGPVERGGFIPVRPELAAQIKFFGRYKRGWIRDGVLLSVG